MDKILETVSPFLFKGDGSNAFAVLDGASLPGLLDRLYGVVRPEFECLYAGDIKPDLAETAPYLVRLEQESEFTEWVLSEGWGKHWGVFAVAPLDFKSFRKHLRRFLVVYDSTTKPLYFRYYDPRVLRVFLPTCKEGELNEFFGPAAFWLMEDEDPATMLRFRLDAGKLVTHKDKIAG